MEHVFWLEPGRIAGRPGPNRVPWDVQAIRAAGIEAILSVNDGEACDAGAIRALGVSYAAVPMPDRIPPAPGDDLACGDALPRAYDFLRGELARGHAVLVHCSSGKDRTGLLLAYHLVREKGLRPEEAIAAVRRVRPIALSADGWEELALRVLR